MADTAMKFGYGNSADIDTAITNGVLDEKDLVLTKDTSELVYIRDDKTKQPIRPRILCFDSKEQAIEELNKNSDTYAGQPISIKDASDGKYYSYTVQEDSSSFTVEPIAATVSDPGMKWVEF